MDRENWTKFTSNDTARIFRDYNEISGHVNLIVDSNQMIDGTEKFQGEDSYKLVGTPTRPIY